MKRDSALKKAKRLIKKKVNWKLPKALVGDKEAYTELSKYIFTQGSFSHNKDDIKILTEGVGTEIFRDDEFVVKMYNELKDAFFGSSDLTVEAIAPFISRKAAFGMIRKNPFCIKELGEKYSDDEEAVKTAVSIKGDSLENASQRLRDDRDVVRAAITNVPTSIRYASERLRGNIELGRYAVSKSGEAFGYLSEGLRDNKEIALIAVKDPKAMAIKKVSGRLKKDIDVAVEAVRANGKAIEYVSIENRGEHAVVSEAIKQAPELIKHASRRYLYSIPLLFKAAVLNSEVLEYVPEEMSRTLVEMLDNYDAANPNKDDNERY